MEVIRVAAVLVWSFKAGAPAGTPPLVGEDSVYYAGADKKLYALRLSDGEKIWSRRFKAPLTVTPVYEGGTIYQYVPFPEGRIYALRPSDGKTLWRARAGPGVVIPAAGGGTVAVGDGREVAFYDRLAGAKKGSVRFEEDVVGAAYAGGEAFVVWTAGGSIALCRPSAEKPSWQKEIAPSGVFGAAARGKVYVVTAAGILAAYDVETGEEAWRRGFGEPVVGAPVGGGDVVYLPGRRTVFASEAATGDVAWTFAPGGNVVGLAAFGEGVVITCEDGRVLAATAEGGEEWLRLEKYGAAGPAVAGGGLLLADGEKRLNYYKIE